MKGDHYFDGFIFTLKKERAMKQIQNIIDRLNEGESLNSEHLEKQLEEFLAN